MNIRYLLYEGVYRILTLIVLWDFEQIYPYLCLSRFREIERKGVMEETWERETFSS